MKENFKRKILKNGMTVLFEKRDVPVVGVAFAVKSGAVNEDISEKGISHFIEHMLYKGTPIRSAKRIAEEIEKNGGVLNGFTDENITAYFCKMPSEHLDIALAVLSDIIKNPLFDKKELEKERKVILEEIKMRHDNPLYCIFDGLSEVLYTGTKGMEISGTIETMSSINREKIVKKFEQVYTPNNLILCVVGDADFETVLDFAEKNFGSKKGNVPAPKFSSKNETKIEKRKGIDQANLVLAYHVPLSTDAKSYAARVLSCLTAEGMSSRLFSEIREKRNLAYAIKGESVSTKFFAYNLIYVGTSKENVENVKNIILEEFRKIAKGLDEKEVAEAKKQIIGNYKISMEDSSIQTINLLSYELDGDAGDFYKFEENIQSVKLEDVKDLSRSAAEKFSFFALVPFD